MFSREKVTNDLSRAKKYFEDIISYTVGPYTLDEIIENRVNTINIVDVREYDDYLDGHIPYATYLPYKDLKEHLEIIDKDKVTVVYTYSDTCPRAFNTALTMVEEKYPAVVLRGGFKEWEKFDFDIIKSDSTSRAKTDNEE